MERDKEKELAGFVKRTVTQIKLEQPSMDFTQQIMSKLETVHEMERASVYKPLISKSVKWMLGGFGLLALAAVFFMETPEWSPKLTNWTSSFTDWWSTSKLLQEPMLELPAIPVSNTYLYGILALTFFVCIQVVVLKNRLDKQYAV